MKALPTLAMIGLIAAAQPASAIGTFESGNSFEAKCRRPEGSYGDGVCSGYITGAADAMASVQSHSDGSVEGRRFGFRWCLPKGVTFGQTVEVVEKWLSSHPETWHLAAPSLVAHALAEGFPCERR